ncbi:ABC transporter substrate-binding protein [Phytoactinopolyspora halotolerans]|uniref:Amino acid ABC transporter substrate-binding protein n=1 Tax=Phytoactinopolyspora halotolerans TaxID=1981512 RepID=A0A6L9SGH5_9ACTN|nr:ABC transporter substrate-binding protein [Phytoactinopolyspora halotolerans]NEE04366.1 amino acid ABC transporter substrate-binding protein [Phytoactinopolyspora halotolerans]
MSTEQRVAHPRLLTTGATAALAGTVVLVAAACGTTTSSTPEATGDPVDAWTSGITDSEVRIGFEYFGEGNGRATDEPDLASNPTAAYVEALVAHINDDGGIGGREIVPVWHRIQRDATSADVEEQALCTDFTQDRPVFLAAAGDTDITRRCFAAEGVPHVVTTASAPASTFDDDSYLVSAPTLNLTRLMRTQVEVLAGHGFFQPDATIGFFSFDAPEYVDARDHGLEPALEEAGLTIAEEALITRPEKPEDVADTLAQVAGAVLKFRDAGVDHVIFLGGSPQFMIDAQKQGYRPRYAISSWDYPASLHESGVPVEQLSGAAGAGYSPARDVADREAAMQPPARQECLDILAAQNLHPETAADEADMLSRCDQLFLIKAALEAAEEPASGHAFMEGISGLGDSFSSASTWDTRYDEAHRDGVASVMYLEFADACECFRYAGDAISVE